jgi:Flp pilus assembly CpaE family ATPase
MAKFATFIADSELESTVIKAINSVQGELELRGVSDSQLLQLSPEVLIVSNLNLNYAKPLIRVDCNMDFEEILKLLKDELPTEAMTFHKGGAKVISFLGLSGGIGTTTLAMNYAFELATKSEVTLVDLNEVFPEIALNLSLHRITERAEHVGPNLKVIQGLPKSTDCLQYVFDLGTNQCNPIMQLTDLLYLVARINGNSLTRLNKLTVYPDYLICNQFERTKAELNWLRQIQDEYPNIKVVTIPYDIKSIEIAAERRSALLEVLPNSPVRKHLATLA